MAVFKMHKAWAKSKYGPPKLVQKLIFCYWIVSKIARNLRGNISAPKFV